MRVNQVTLFFGTRGSGKTWFANKEMIPSYRAAHQQQKVLIVDTLDHPDYRYVPRIEPGMLARWNRASIYRIYGSNTKEIFAAVRANVRNALVIWEDASKYLEGRLDEDVRNFVLDTKQINVDLVFMFHGFSYCPPKLFSIADNYTIFRTTSPQGRKGVIPNYEEVLATYEAVQRSRKKFPRKTVRIY